MSKRDVASLPPESKRNEEPSELLRELVAHLRQNRTQLREEWVVRISETRLLTAMTKEEIFAEATSVYDSYVEALETEAFEALQAPRHSKRCKRMRETSRNASFHAVSKRTKSWGSSCCCATSLHVPSSRNTRMISRN